MIRSWRNSPEVAEFHSEREPITAEKQRKWFESISRDPDTRVWVILRDGEPLGVSHIKDVHRHHMRAEVGLYLADPEVRGGPFGPETLFLVLRYGFEQMNLHKIYGHYLADNEPARRLNAYLGFVEEGLLRDEVYVDGEFEDYVRIGLLEENFVKSEGYAFFNRGERK